MFETMIFTGAFFSNWKLLKYVDVVLLCVKSNAKLNLEYIKQTVKVPCKFIVSYRQVLLE